MTRHIKIINNIRNDCCLLCHSRNVFKVGNIPYDEPVHFSTNEIELEFIPELWKCSKCNSSFVQNRVPESMAIALYSQGASAERWSREPFQLQKPVNQIECLQQYFSEGSKVLDIGCNTGELLDYAKLLGCETAGVEYSENSREILVGKSHSAFSSMSEVRQKFDVITAFDLVEHLYDMLTFFLNCRNMLNKDGVLIVLTGNIGSLSARLCKSKWWYLRYPEHIAFPSRQYFARYSGFLVKEWVQTYASKGYQCGWPLILRGLARGVVKSRYNGLPSIGPDHVLAVLKDEA
jgi:2-polyprenyl-3-methyl-5-hydroxy-6-metoxy-1,4-benzoquinol methylase